MMDYGTVGQKHGAEHPEQAAGAHAAVHDAEAPVRSARRMRIWGLSVGASALVLAAMVVWSAVGLSGKAVLQQQGLFEVPEGNVEVGIPEEGLQGGRRQQVALATDQAIAEQAEAALSSPTLRPLPARSTAVPDEGGNAASYPDWARNAQMRREYQFETGKPGWEPGPDYYSTEKWDNTPVYPSSAHPHFDPYTGKGGCDKCRHKYQGAYILSVNPRCDGDGDTENLRKILGNKVTDPFKSVAWDMARYQEWTWAEQQLTFLFNFYEDLTIVIPPCFIPNFLWSNGALGDFNDGIYQRGLNVLLIGGLQGSDFLSRFLAGKEGYGYVEEGNSERGASPKNTVDRVWSEGPFYKQTSAVTTELNYAAPLLRQIGNSVVGIPVSELPPDTIHYYMSHDEISVVFEIPAGPGRIFFIGFDYDRIVPQWADLLLLTERELSIEQEAKKKALLEEFGVEAEAEAEAEADATNEAAAPPPNSYTPPSKDTISFW